MIATEQCLHIKKPQNMSVRQLNDGESMPKKKKLTLKSIQKKEKQSRRKRRHHTDINKHLIC